MVTRKLRELTDTDIAQIADAHRAFVAGTLENVKGFCAVATTEEIRKQDYILTPGRYVGIEDVEDDGGTVRREDAAVDSGIKRVV